MKRRSLVGGTLAGLPITGEFATPQKVKTGDIPTTTFGKTGVKVSVIAQGGSPDEYPSGYSDSGGACPQGI